MTPEDYLRQYMEPLQASNAESISPQDELSSIFLSQGYYYSSSLNLETYLDTLSRADLLEIVHQVFATEFPQQRLIRRQVGEYLETLQRLKDERAWRQAEMERLNGELAWRVDELMNVGAERKRLETLVIDLHTELENCRSRIAVLKKECATLRAMLAELQGSASWKVTAPLRRFSTIFVHDHNERVSFTGNAAQAQGWVGDDLQDGKKLGIAMLLVSPVAGGGKALRALAGRAGPGPMHEAAARARRALRGDGELELPVRGIGDEWDELAQVTNELLRAQAHATAQAKAFSANAAHELRTPLTAMLGEVQVTLRRDRNAEEYRGALLIVEEEARRLGRLVEVLLALARADAGTLNPATIRFDIARAARLAADRAIVAHKGADRRLALRLAPATALGDPLLTGRVFDNLLDNALRHGGEQVVEDPPGEERVAQRRGRSKPEGEPAVGALVGHGAGNGEARRAGHVRRGGKPG